MKIKTLVDKIQRRITKIPQTSEYEVFIKIGNNQKIPIKEVAIVMDEIDFISDWIELRG